MEDKKDYHEYVFKNHQLVGDFENMYQNSINTPWHQNEIENFFDIPLSKTLLKSHAPYSSLLEIGCGLGYYLNEIAEVTNSNKIWGIDISKTAVEKAKIKFPQFNYAAANIASPDFLTNFHIEEGFDIIVIRGFFWYVFDKMDIVVHNLEKCAKKGGCLFIHQNFPPLESDFVGKDVLPNPNALINFFRPYFSLVFRNEFNMVEKKTNDHWLSVLLKK